MLYRPLGTAFLVAFYWIKHQKASKWFNLYLNYNTRSGLKMLGTIFWLGNALRVLSKAVPSAVVLMKALTSSHLGPSLLMYLSHPSFVEVLWDLTCIESADLTCCSFWAVKASTTSRTFHNWFTFSSHLIFPLARLWYYVLTTCTAVSQKPPLKKLSKEKQNLPLKSCLGWTLRGTWVHIY